MMIQPFRAQCHQMVTFQIFSPIKA